MSKVIKGVKKVFKKVTKVVKKLAPVVLGAAAIYFTAGAALGAGGWSAVAGNIGSTLGTGMLSRVVTGALTKAGQGALIGGVVSKASGGSFTQGAKAGAGIGALAGGISGAFTPAAAQPAAAIENMGAADEAASMGANFSHDGGLTATAQQVAGSGGGSAGSGGGGLLREGGWLERNQGLVGNVVSGLGQGLMAKGEAEGEIDVLREKNRLTGQNYTGVDPGAGFRPVAPGASGQSPMQRFDPSSYGQFEYQYNPQSGRIEKVAKQS
jgi:hypothetical protein